MPNYDYKCQNCSYKFEIFQSMKDDILKKCPKCSQNMLQRLISGGSALIFRGSGFYVNDSKTKTTEPSNKTDTSGDTNKTMPST